MDVTEQGFVPAVLTVPRGRSIVVVFTRRAAQTCGTDVVFPSLHRGYDLPLGRPVSVSLAAHEVGDSLRYGCSMDMIRGVLVAK